MGGRWSPFLFELVDFRVKVWNMRDALLLLLEPPIEALGYELVEIEFAREGRGGILRIFIDRPVADDAASITVDDCANVSHAVSQVLEVEDSIQGHYTLEVSSPGFIGERIVAELKLPMNGRRRFVGLLKSMSDDTIVVEVDGQAYSLPLERIQKARLRPE
jgi:ribosome maturation factor RimP